MVEGGAQVIASFFAADSLSKERAIDTVIMTVAPILVGRGGVDYGLDLQEVREVLIVYFHSCTHQVTTSRLASLTLLHV